MEVEKKLFSDTPTFVFMHRRKLIAAFALASLFLMSIESNAVFHREGYEQVIAAGGWILVLTGLAIRFWAALYIAGNRDRNLQTSGPYGLVRNPLYLGNLVSTAGIGVLSTSIAATLCLVAGLSFVFYETIEHEDKKLLGIFGEDFIAYRARVPRLLPRISDIRLFPFRNDARQTVSYANFGSELKSARGVISAALLVYLYSAVLMQL